MTSWRRSHELFGRGGVDQNPKTEPVDIAAEVGHGHAAGDQDRGGGDQGPVRGVTDQDRGATAGGGETRGRRGDGQSQGPSLTSGGGRIEGVTKRLSPLCRRILKVTGLT